MVKRPLTCLHRSYTPPLPDTCFPVSATLARPTLPGARLPAACTTLHPTRFLEVSCQEARGLSDHESSILLTTSGENPAAFSLCGRYPDSLGHH